MNTGMKTLRFSFRFIELQKKTCRDGFRRGGRLDRKAQQNDAAAIGRRNVREVVHGKTEELRPLFLRNAVLLFCIENKENAKQ